MVLLVDYLTNLDIVLIMQKMEAVSFSRFRRASKRLYKLADEAKDLSVMVDRSLFLYLDGDPLYSDTLKAAVCKMRFDLRYHGFFMTKRPYRGSILLPLENSSPFIGFTFSQLEMSHDFIKSGHRRGFQFPILKDCNWKRTTLITEKTHDSLFEVVHPKELYMPYMSFVRNSKPFPISIKRMSYSFGALRMEFPLLENIKHMVYHCSRYDVKELVHDYFEYWFNENGVMPEILEVCPISPSYFPIVLSIKGAIKHIENMAFEMVLPHFPRLHWEKVNSSVIHCNRTVNNKSQRGDKADLQMFDIKLTNRAKGKKQWIYAVLRLKARRPWDFYSNLQIQFSKPI